MIKWRNRPATLNFLRDVTERKCAEETLQRRLEFERLITTLCTGFINPGHIDEKIDKTLKAIGEFAGVDRAYVFQLREDGRTADNTHEWCADGIQPQIEGLKGIVLDEALPWFWEKLGAHETFHVPAVAELPPEAHLETAHFEMQQIQALVVVTMLSEGSLRGFLGFDSVRSRKTWPQNTIALLTIAGENISLALDRERAESKLRESRDILEKTFSSLDSAIFILDAAKSPTIQDCNPAASRVFGYEKEQMVGRTTEFLHVSKESLREFQSTLYPTVEEDGYLSFFEFKMKRKSGEVFPSEHSVLPLKGDNGRRIGWISVVRDMTDRVKAEEALRQSEERYRKLFEEAQDGILLGDAHTGIVVECNRAAAEMLERDRSELIGQHQRILHPPSRIKDGYSLTFTKHAQGSEGQVLEDQIITRTGQIKDVAIKANFVQVGNRRLLQAMFRDITERKRAEDALRESENRHRSMIELAPDAIVVLNKLGVLVSCNSAAEKISGYSKEELVGRHFSKLGAFRLKDIPKSLDLFARIVKGRIQEPFEVDFVRRDGTSGVVEIRVSLLGDGNIQAIATDISDRKQAEQKLLEDRAKLKSLASQLSLTEERERRQIATELHDRIGQSLVISKIKLDELREAADSGGPAEALQEVCDTLGQVIQDTRVLTFDLSFPILYELGFEAAVAEWLAEQIQEKHGIETTFEDDGRPKPLDDDIRVLLFRNVRELLINVVKHANARSVKVSIRKVGRKICVTVADDGVGFDPAEATSTANGMATFGLFSIRERLEQLEGYLEIQSQRGRGTKITMTAPLK